MVWHKNKNFIRPPPWRYYKNIIQVWCFHFWKKKKEYNYACSMTLTYNYSGTSPYGHLTSKKTSPLQSPWLSPKLYSTVQITPCNKVTSPLRSLLPSPVGDLNSEVPLYCILNSCCSWKTPSKIIIRSISGSVTPAKTEVAITGATQWCGTRCTLPVKDVSLNWQYAHYLMYHITYLGWGRMLWWETALNTRLLHSDNTSSYSPFYAVYDAQKTE